MVSVAQCGRGLNDYPELGIEVESWEAIAQKQEPVTRSTLLSAAEGLILSLQDQSMCSQTNWRPVVVRLMRRAGEVHVFDQHHDIIHDTSCGILRGRMNWQKFLDAFDGKLGAKKFRTPVQRAPPRDRYGENESRGLDQERVFVGGPAVNRVLLAQQGKVDLSALLDAHRIENRRRAARKEQLDTELTRVMDNGVRPNSAVQVPCL